MFIFPLNTIKESLKQEDFFIPNGENVENCAPPTHTSGEGTFYPKWSECGDRIIGRME